MSSQKRLVTQSNKLVEASYSMTVLEQKLVYTMISLIHPKDVKFNRNEIRLDELYSIIKIKKTNGLREVQKAIGRLEKREVSISTDEGKFVQMNWASDIRIKNGKFRFKFSEGLASLLLKQEGNFTSYDLRIATRFKCMYTARIYMLLKQYSKFGCRVIDLLELRQILGIADGSYKEFKQFNAWVLQKAKKEFETPISEGGDVFNSDITFNIETSRADRKVASIKFTILRQEYMQAVTEAETTEYADEVKNDVLKQLIRFGFAGSLSRSLIAKKGSDAIKEAISVYEVALGKDLVTNKSGGYLRTLIESGAKGASQYENEQKEKASLKQAEALKEQQLMKEVEQQKRDQYELLKKLLLDNFDKLTEKEKTEVSDEFSESLNPVFRNFYNNDGLNNKIISSCFIDFLKNKQQPNSNYLLDNAL